MAVARRLLAGGLATVLALALTMVPSQAATRRPTPTPKPTPALLKKAPTVIPPQIYQLNPLKVNPTVQPNIMILGQSMTPATTVYVSGPPATTVQAPDANPLLANPPDNLSQASYVVESTKQAETTKASNA